MMNTQIWNNVVPDGMKELPIPLSGHCSVMINSNKVLIIGGETTDGVNEEWLDRYSAHHVTDHVHIYKFSTDKTCFSIHGSNFKAMYSYIELTCLDWIYDWL